MRTHTAYRPLQCTMVGCGRRFTQTLFLFAHHVQGHLLSATQAKRRLAAVPGLDPTQLRECANEDEQDGYELEEETSILPTLPGAPLPPPSSFASARSRYLPLQHLRKQRLPPHATPPRLPLPLSLRPCRATETKMKTTPRRKLPMKRMMMRTEVRTKERAAVKKMEKP
eukprot:GAFH01004829.1.p2 GENE.GAFH01004829.1~~GAFH01004829.1.p2  ORF type:complete len:169 (-),score=18.92 GAFH01004829.1:8-514(-)